MATMSTKQAGSLPSKMTNKACKNSGHFTDQEEGKKKISRVIFLVSFIWLPETVSFRGTSESY